MPDRPASQGTRERATNGCGERPTEEISRSDQRSRTSEEETPVTVNTPRRSRRPTPKRKPADGGDKLTKSRARPPPSLPIPFIGFVGLRIAYQYKPQTGHRARPQTGRTPARLQLCIESNNNLPMTTPAGAGPPRAGTNPHDAMPAREGAL